MNNVYTSCHSVINLYKKNSAKSDIVTQMIYGESFTVINRLSEWIKIKIKEDGYIGYIKKIYILKIRKNHIIFMCIL